MEIMLAMRGAVLFELFTWSTGRKSDEVTRSREKYVTRSLRSVLFTKYYLGDLIKQNEVVEACSTFGGEERCIRGFGGET